jgi:hypothetical protein
MFSPFALVWSGGVYGRVAQQVSYWSNRIQEQFVVRMAQRREERRLREEDNSIPAVAAAETGPASAPPEPVALEPVAAEPAPESTPPIIAAEDAPDILLQPAPAAADPAKPSRAKRKTKREANPAGEGPSTGGG